MGLHVCDTRRALHGLVVARAPVPGVCRESERARETHTERREKERERERERDRKREREIQREERERERPRNSCIRPHLGMCI